MKIGFVSPRIVRSDDGEGESYYRMAAMMSIPRKRSIYTGAR